MYKPIIAALVVIALPPTNAAILGMTPSWAEFTHKTCGEIIELTDEMFSASTSHYSTLTFNTWKPHYARIGNDGLQNAWMPEFDDDFNLSWLQIDFGVNSDKIITGINTQGASRYLKDYYMKEYMLETSLDGINWKTVQDTSVSDKEVGYQTNGDEDVKSALETGDLLFTGNKDDDTEHFNFMPRLIIARFLRIRPLDWKRVPAIRLDLYGCDFEPGMPIPTGVNDLYESLAFDN